MSIRPAHLALAAILFVAVMDFGVLGALHLAGWLLFLTKVVIPLTRRAYPQKARRRRK